MSNVLQVLLSALFLAASPAFAINRWGPPPLSSAEYESSPTFSPDGAEIIFMRADPAFRAYRLVRSQCRAGAWTDPKPLPFAAKPPASDADPFLTPDGRRLYFISTREAQKTQTFDIWYADRLGEEWAQPVRLPAPINTEHSELLPRMTADGTLYFGSDRPGGLGGGDIYVARQDGAGTWEVRNLGAPVSTFHFDYEAEVSQDGRVLVVVSDRGDRSHLYTYAQRDGAWVATGRIPARDDVFQVGPLLSPDGTMLLFAQADGVRSGEFFLHTLRPAADAEPWPRPCAK